MMIAMRTIILVASSWTTCLLSSVQAFSPSSGTNTLGPIRHDQYKISSSIHRIHSSQSVIPSTKNRHPIRSLSPQSFPLMMSNRRNGNIPKSVLSVAVSGVNINGDTSQSRLLSIHPAMSASLLILLDTLFRQGFKALSISFPSSLAGCCLLFASMLTLPIGPKMFQILNPGAALLTRWLPVFFVPSLITLPLVESIGPSTEVRISYFLAYHPGPHRIWGQKY